MKITPDLNTFDEDKSTAGRVADITSSGSPLMTLACDGTNWYEVARSVN